MSSFGDYHARMLRMTATDYSWGTSSSGKSRTKPQTPPLTIPNDFELATDKRSSYHKSVLEPKRKARQEEKIRKEAEDLEKKKKKEARELARYRRSLVHRPLPIPSFNKPFRPSYGSATPPERPRTPNHTSEKRTKSATPRMYRQKSPAASPSRSSSPSHGGPAHPPRPPPMVKDSCDDGCKDPKE